MRINNIRLQLCKGRWNYRRLFFYLYFRIACIKLYFPDKAEYLNGVQVVGVKKSLTV